VKHCPECDSFFSDAEHFCEVDGTQLVAVDDAPNPLPVHRTGVASHPKSSQTLLPLGVLVGILLGALLVLTYFAMSRQRSPENSNTTSSSSSARQQEFLNPQQPPRPATASPSVEPSVEPSASPSIETPSPQDSSTHVELSGSSPISTAPGAKEPVVIRLVSGGTIEAEEAWQTAEGIWYRKQSVVSLLDPKNVKVIEKVSPAAPQPSASTSPSP
jgi:cytoskeletal protein RodZ